MTSSNIIFSSSYNKHVFSTPNESSVILSKGVYRFELWGASGGSSPDSEPGKGGFIEGTTKIYEETKAFVFVGGKGNSDSTDCISMDLESYYILSGGFNGGGSTWTSQYGGSGGGASDIRINNKTLNDRVIVAGGGGGAAFSSFGGDGGYPNGTDAKCDGYYAAKSLGAKGTQTKGGEFIECSLGYCIENNPKYVRNGFTNSIGEFGAGGNGMGRNCGGGGGGGGWFGGAGNYNAGGGGGGSSYISSSLVLISHITGEHIGDGKVIITYLSSLNDHCTNKLHFCQLRTMIFIYFIVKC